MSYSKEEIEIWFEKDVKILPKKQVKVVKQELNPNYLKLIEKGFNIKA